MRVKRHRESRNKVVGLLPAYLINFGAKGLVTSVFLAPASHRGGNAYNSAI